jgi:CLIP-associating protein 1/2
VPPDDPSSLIEDCIATLVAGPVDSPIFYRIAGLSLQNPVTMSPPMSPANDPLSPTPFDSSQSLPSLHYDAWEKNKNFSRLLKAMVEQLTPEKVGLFIL